MTLTFESENDVIVYALERIIPYAKQTQQIFGAHCIWWLASIIGLEQGSIDYIDNIEKRESAVTLGESSGIVHPDRAQQIELEKAVSPTLKDLTENQRLDLVLEEAEQVIQDSIRDRSAVQRNRVNPLPRTKAQLKKARKIKRLQEARNNKE
jgi:hypothetical protein